MRRPWRRGTVGQRRDAGSDWQTGPWPPMGGAFLHTVRAEVPVAACNQASPLLRLNDDCTPPLTVARNSYFSLWFGT